MQKNSNASSVNDTANVLYAAFDFGTNTSCLMAATSRDQAPSFSRLVPTIVGYAGPGIVENLLPGNAKVLFGEDALKHRLHLNMVQPMVNGAVRDANASRDFANYLRGLIDGSGDSEIRAVIGLPANADRSALESMRKVVDGLFDRVILIPEPFLAALGVRDESRLHTPDYIDPVQNSLFIDMGAGTTDLCLIQGYYPTAKDQLSFPFAGDAIDALLDESIRKTYPDCNLSIFKVREIKEQNAFVGNVSGPVTANVYVAGKPRQLEVGPQVKAACEELLKKIVESAEMLIARAPSDSVPELLKNVILTGGCSRIRNLDAEVQRLLAEAGYENPKVSVVSGNYKEYVAKGALKAALSAREDQWQQV